MRSFIVNRLAVEGCFLLASVLGGCASARITPDPVYFPPPPSQARVVHLKSFNRLSELVTPVRRSGGIFGRKSADALVARPAGIAYHSDHLYICDAEARCVHVWDLAAGSARRIGHRGEATLAKPVAVAVDEEGRVYVADTQRGAVMAFDRNGSLLRRFRRGDRDEYRPVALAASNDELYVADVAGMKIDVFSTLTGRYARSINGSGSTSGGSFFPMGIAFENDRRWYASDTMSSRVAIFDGGRYAGSFGQPGNRYGTMGKPRDLAVGPDGVIFVTDVEFARVHMFNRQGDLLMLFGGARDGLESTPMPVGITVASQLPESLASLVPNDFDARYFLFVTNSVGMKRISLFAVGRSP